MAIKFWMRTWEAIDNTASFMYDNCLGCFRYWNAEARPAGRPECLLHSWHWKRIDEESQRDPPHYYEYEIPDYIPGHCGKFEEK